MPSESRSQKSWVRAHHEPLWKTWRGKKGRDNQDPSFPHYVPVPHNPRYPPNHDFTPGELAMPPVPHQQQAFNAGPEGVFNAFGAPHVPNDGAAGDGGAGFSAAAGPKASGEGFNNSSDKDSDENDGPVFGNGQPPYHHPASSQTARAQTSRRSPLQSQVHPQPFDPRYLQIPTPHAGSIRHTRSPSPTAQAHAEYQGTSPRQLRPGELERLEQAGQTEQGERVRGVEESRYVETEQTRGGGRGRGDVGEGDEGKDDHPWNVKTEIYREQVTRVKRSGGG